MKEIAEVVEELAAQYADLISSGVYSNEALNARKDGMADALHSAFGKSWIDCRQWISAEASTIIREPFYVHFAPLTRGHDIDRNTKADIWYSSWKKRDDGAIVEITQRQGTTTVMVGKTPIPEILSNFPGWHDAEESILRQLTDKYYGSDLQE